MMLLAAMAAVDLIAQYTVAATDLPQLLGVSPDVIRFLRVRLGCWASTAPMVVFNPVLNRQRWR